MSRTIDQSLIKMDNKMIFFNIGWMDFYRGLGNDTIKGGGKHVATLGWGEELFNFKVHLMKLYGYVQPKIDRTHSNPSTIHLEKIGGTKDDDSVDNVTLVWTANDPINGGTYIVGWYKNATIYRYYQKAPKNSERRHKKLSLGYYATTKFSDAKLLPKDERIVRVKRKTKNWMGQSNVWYADKNPAFVKQVNDYIFRGVLPKIIEKPNKGGKASQQDPLKRIEVEKKAILIVTRYYKKLGYSVESYEKDNLGWDLEVTSGRTTLKVEVKGLSGKTICAELTPNELRNLRADTNSYRLCIVTETLTDPNLRIFAHSLDNNSWTCEDGAIIKFEEAVSARVYV